MEKFSLSSSDFAFLVPFISNYLLSATPFMEVLGFCVLWKLYVFPELKDNYDIPQDVNYRALKFHQDRSTNLAIKRQ